MNDWVTSQKEELRSDFLKLVLYELNGAISPKEKRRTAVQAAIDEFNHNNCHKHDQELELQADKILLQKLSYCFTVHKYDNEMGILACALEMVYRASRGRLAISFQEVQDSILPLFVEILRWSVSRRKDILATIHSKNQTQNVPTNKISYNIGEASVISAGTFYTKMKDTKNHKLGMNGNKNDDDVGNSHPNEQTNGHLYQTSFNDNASFVSILKNKSISGASFTGKVRMPDEPPKEIPQNIGFTIECIPNGTENACFAPEELGNDYKEANGSSKTGEEEVKETSKNEDEEAKRTSKNKDENCGEVIQKKDIIGPASTATEGETLPSRVSEEKSEFLHKAGLFTEHRRQRQVRFSETLQSPETLLNPLNKIQSHSSQQEHFMDHALNSTSIDGGAQNSIPEQQRRISTKEKNERYTHPLSVLKVLKILRYFSRVLSAMVPMAHFPGLLDELIFQMKIRKASTDGTHSILRKGHSAKAELDDDLNSFISARSTESGQVSVTKQRSSQFLDNSSAARMDAIATLVNLACAEENKMKLFSHRGLLDAVIHVAEHDFIDSAREHASIVLMNLALAEENKLSMVDHDDFILVLLKLVKDKVINTRRYASSTLLNLVGTPKNTHRIASFGKGKLLHIMTRVLVTDEVEEVRINVAEAFFNLVKNGTDMRTIELIGRHRDVMSTLASTVISDYSADVRAYSARTLEWLAADIHFGSQSHPGLLDALMQASKWTKTNCIAEALKAQASMEENRIAMVTRPEMLNTLAMLAGLHKVNDEEVRECALATIERLTQEPYVRKAMVRHEGIMMELTRATFSANNILDNYEEHDKISRALMKAALKNLANEL